MIYILQEKFDENKNLQVEVAWALTNIVSGDDHYIVSELVAINAIPTLIALINRHYEKRVQN